MKRCRTCRHFEPDTRHPPWGECNKWLRGYDVQVSNVPLDGVLVEDDEGWAMIVGPDFGCVLHEDKTPGG